MKSVVLLICVCLFFINSPTAGQERPASLPPITERQIAQVRELVQITQAQTTLLQARLSQRQRQLARLYSLYDLDEAQVRELQEEIIQLQRQLLEGHHRMQTQLRTIVGRERFEFLRRRLEQAVSFGPGADDRAPENTKESNQ
jgi:TolA-binding protein